MNIETAEQAAAALREAGVEAGSMTGLGARLLGDVVTIPLATAIDLLDMTLSRTGTEQADAIVTGLAEMPEPLDDEYSQCVFCGGPRLGFPGRATEPHTQTCLWRRAVAWAEEWA